MSLAASEGAELVFCGADDFKASAPQGDQYAVTAVRVNKNGVETPLKRRTPVMDERTARYASGFRTEATGWIYTRDY